MSIRSALAALLLNALTCGLVAAHSEAASMSARGATTTPAAVPGSEPGVALFSAHYQADWKSMSVGSSDLELRQDTAPGHYIYTWTITAHGIFRMIYRDDLVQKSWLRIRNEHVLPLKYSAVDGSATANLDFDWDAGRARGKTEKKDVDLQLELGTQDVMSIQVEVMLDLKNGDLPKTFQVIDRDEVKEFMYAKEGTATIGTAIGDLDTIIVSSRRPGGNRILTMWFAPSLGFVPVKAERTRDGKLEFAMRIKSLKRL